MPTVKCPNRRQASRAHKTWSLASPHCTVASTLAVSCLQTRLRSCSASLLDFLPKQESATTSAWPCQCFCCRCKNHRLNSTATFTQIRILYRCEGSWLSSGMHKTASTSCTRHGQTTTRQCTFSLFATRSWQLSTRTHWYASCLLSRSSTAPSTSGRKLQAASSLPPVCWNRLPT